jgi:hypothetical protein
MINSQIKQINIDTILSSWYRAGCWKLNNCVVFMDVKEA